MMSSLHYSDVYCGFLQTYALLPEGIQLYVKAGCKMVFKVRGGKRKVLVQVRQLWMHSFKLSQ